MKSILEVMRKENTPPDQNEFGWNVLHTCTLEDDSIALSKYIKMYPLLVNKGNIYGVTALHLAIRWDRITCLDILLGYSNINVNVIDEDGWTPLHDSVRLNRLQCLQILLRHSDIIVNVIDKYGLSPIYYTARTGSIECTKLLIQRDQTAMNSLNYWGCNLIHNFVRYGRTECLSIILQSNINVNVSDILGSTPLHYAAMYTYKLREEKQCNSRVICFRLGRNTCLDLLIDKGYANINTVNNSGYTALHYAITKGKSECAMKLINRPNINVDIRMKSGHTPIHLAVQADNYEVIKELIDKRHARTDIPDSRGWVCEHTAAAEAKIDVLQILDERNLINIYAKTNYGETLLEFACRQKKTLKFLLKMNDKYGFDLIQHAALQKHEKLFHLLVKHYSKLQNEKSISNEFNSKHTIKGREDELEYISTTLNKHNKIAVTGPGGIGKTALVKFYWFSCQNNYFNLVWIDCQSTASLKKSFIKAARFLFIPTKKYEIYRELNLIVKDVFNELQKKPSLIVFDNITKTNIADTYLRNYSNIHIILIARLYIFTDVNSIELGPITEAAAVEFFKPLFQDKILQETDRDNIALLTKKLKYIPIALVTAKCYIMTEYLSLDLNRYIKDLEDEQNKLSDTYIPEFVSNEFNPIIYSTFIVILNKHSTFDLLTAAIFLDPINIDLKTLIRLEILMYNTEKLEKLCAFIRNSIIQVSNNLVFINSFIRKLILYHPKYKVNICKCYRNVIKLLLEDDYTQHYNHIFRLSFKDEYPLPKIFVDFHSTKILKPLVRYSYINSLKTMFKIMPTSKIQEYVKKFKLLHEAVKSGDINIVELIFQYDDNIKATNESGHTMIWEAVNKNHMEVLRFLISKGASYKQIDKLNKTPLHRAAFLGKTETVKFLLTEGVDPNIRNKFQRTPLHYAAMEGHNEVIVQLLNQDGININARDHYRRSPVFETVRCYRLETLRLFIEKGAKIDTKDNLDLSPVRLAKLQKHKKEILEVFKKYKLYIEPVKQESCYLFCKIV